VLFTTCWKIRMFVRYSVGYTQKNNKNLSFIWTTICWKHYKFFSFYPHLIEHIIKSFFLKYIILCIRIQTAAKSCTTMNFVEKKSLRKQKIMFSFKKKKKKWVAWPQVNFLWTFSKYKAFKQKILLRNWKTYQLSWFQKNINLFRLWYKSELF
jgi:hypothetical protein